MGTFTKAVTDSSFDSEVINSQTPTLVDFWAEWCGPCRALAPKLEEVAQELSPNVKIVKVNVDENPATPGKFHVRGIPAMLLFKGGVMVDQLVGNHPKEAIVDFLKKNI